MAYYNSLFTGALRDLRRLRRLELKGSLHNEHNVNSVVVLLQNTRKLEVLMLFPQLPDLPKKKAGNYYYLSDSDCDEQENDKRDKNNGDYSGNVHVPSRLNMANIRCFESRLRRINIVGYGGRPFKRMLAKFLLSKAAALEEFCVSIAPRRAYRDETKRELESWLNVRTRVTCNCP
ncbi:unnamed protein product [Urochloa humidicola]